MIPKVGNLRLGLQIGLIVAIAVASFLLVGAVYLGGTHAVSRGLARADAVAKVDDDTRRLSNDLLQLRRAEKNFLARADRTYAEEHAQIARRVIGGLDALEHEVGAIGRHDVEADVVTIVAGVRTYAAAFERLVEARVARGLTPESGLEGALRDSAHRLEASAKAADAAPVTIDLLGMRRHEKDFMLRHADKYAAAFDEVAATLGERLRRAAATNPELRDGESALAGYVRDFHAWVERDRTVAATEKAMMTAHRGIEPVIERVETTVAALAAATRAEAVDLRQATERRILWIFGAVLALLTASGVLIVRAIVRPLAGMTGVMGRLAGGDLDVEIPARERTNEIGAMARAVVVFRDNAVERRRLEAAQAGEAARVEAERRRAMHGLADEFERRIGSVVSMVSSAATELEAAAQTLSASSEEASAQSTAVAGASEEATANVGSVAAATEQLAGTVHEVGRQVSMSTEIAAKASDEAAVTRTQVHGLSEAADRIGSIVQLIQDIASQTNLLALNATIEAARAGEAGRGFAIVAQEVKGLAGQTARATAEIGAQVQEIQGSTRHAAEAIATIDATIGEMNGVASAIAAAVEEQGITTREIARNLAQAARGAAEVSSNIVGVSTASETSSAASTQVLSAAAELARQSETLRATVTTFLRDVRAA